MAALLQRASVMLKRALLSQSNSAQSATPKTAESTPKGGETVLSDQLKEIEERVRAETRALTTSMQNRLNAVTKHYEAQVKKVVASHNEVMACLTEATSMVQQYHEIKALIEEQECSDCSVAYGDYDAASCPNCAGLKHALLHMDERLKDQAHH